MVIGHIDPNTKIAGKGIEKLTNAGIKVTTKILKKECLNLNKRYLTYVEKKRPFIILKWAQTIDGFIDVNRNENSVKHPTWITDEISRTLVHKWRNEEQAILVGRNTVEMDNPQLTNRSWGKISPLRIVIDKELTLDKKLKIYDKSVKTLVFNLKKNKKEQNLEYFQLKNPYNIIAQILNELYKRKIQSIMIEGGEILLTSFIRDNLWDEARIFIGNKNFKEGVKAPVFRNETNLIEKLKNSKLLIYNNF